MVAILKLLMLVFFLAAPLHAQQQDVEPAQETEQDENQNDAQQEDNSETLPDIDSQPIQAGAGGPGRFIPSEQISQDSGVSFPVDI